MPCADAAGRAEESAWRQQIKPDWQKFYVQGQARQVQARIVQGRKTRRRKTRKT